MVEKEIVDGKVAVIYSPGYGAGWSTWNSNSEEMAWMIYDLDHDATSNQFHLARKNVLYTRFKESLTKVSQPLPGNVEAFVEVLQEKLDRQSGDSERNPPDAPTLDQLL